jgi:hypothetical protein
MHVSSRPSYNAALHGDLFSSQFEKTRNAGGSERFSFRNEACSARPTHQKVKTEEAELHPSTRWPVSAAVAEAHKLSRPAMVKA